MTRPLAELRVLSRAHAIALQAKCGLLRREDLAQLCGAAAQHLTDDDPVRLMVSVFAESARTHGRQPHALAAAGTDLQQAVRRALWPVPQDLGRSDIHG
ncbi:MAG: hypothetical protein ACOH2H_16110 [Cypionkella sp.]